MLFVGFWHPNIVRSGDWQFPKEASTSKEWAQQNRSYFEHFAELYKERTKDAGAVKEQGIDALQFEAARIAASRLAPATALLQNDPLLEKSSDGLDRLRQIVLAGSSDPWILKVLAGLATEDSAESRLRLIDQSLEQFADSTYPPALRIRLLHHRMSLAKEIKDVKLERESVLDIYQILPDYIRYIGDHPEFSRLAISLIKSVFAEYRLLVAGGNPMIDQLASDQTLDPWLVAMTRGHYFDQRGWRYRGGGFASTVDAGDFDFFHEDQQNAAKEFLKAHQIAPQRPEAATGLIRVSMTSGPVDGRDSADWFQQSLNAQLDYFPSVQSYLWSLRPRWGGSHTEMLQFGLDMVKSDRYDSGLPDVLMDALYDVYDELGDWNRVIAFDGVYEAVVTHLDRRLAQTAAADEHANLRTHYATQRMALANVHGDYDEAVRWQQDWGDHLNPNVLRSFDLDSEAALAGIAANAIFGPQYFELSGSDDPMYLRIEDPVSYAAQMRSALEKLSENGSDQRAKPYVEQRLRLAEMCASV